eukprot:m.30078 g.30078  ORF g.30078 m.30078 type:complete len:109 (+) comp13829_c0_seq1:225-551(+)
MASFWPRCNARCQPQPSDACEPPLDTAIARATCNSLVCLKGANHAWWRSPVQCSQSVHRRSTVTAAAVIIADKSANVLCTLRVRNRYAIKTTDPCTSTVHMHLVVAAN